MKPVISVHDLFGVWPSIEQTFRQGLPLKNLTWQPSAGVVHTIPVLDVEIKPYDVSEGFEFRNDIRLLTQPALNILAVKCDDIEVYRQHVRQLLKEWHSIVSSRMGQEWMIVFVVATDPAFHGGSTSKSSSSKFLSSKNAVYEKIRSDFNPSSKLEHCVQIRLGDGKVEMTEAFEILFRKTKSLILSSMALKIDLIKQDLEEDPVGSTPTTENMAPAFVRKENLALIYEMLWLFPDALSLYDELDAALRKLIDLFEVPKAFRQVNMARSNAREKIFDHDVNLVELVVRVFHQQMSLLVKEERYPDMLTRAYEWLSQTGRTTPNGDMRILQSCRKWQIIEDLLICLPIEAYSEEIAGPKGDIEFLQRNAMKEMAFFLYPDLMQTPEGGIECRKLLDKEMPEGRLRQIVGSEASIESYLEGLAETTLIDFKFAGKSRDVELLHVDIAKELYYSERENFSTAAYHFELARDWIISTASKLPHDNTCEAYLDCLLKAEEVEKFLHSALEILASCKDTRLCEKLVKDIDATCTNTQHSCEVDLADYAVPSIGRYASTSSQLNTTKLKVDVKNLLPVAWRANSIQLCLINEDEFLWQFQCSEHEIQPKTTSCEVTSEVSPYRDFAFRR